MSAFLRLIKSITEFQIKHLDGAWLSQTFEVSHRQPPLADDKLLIVPACVPKHRTLRDFGEDSRDQLLEISMRGP